MKKEIDKAINGLVSFGRDLKDVHVARDMLYKLVSQNDLYKYMGVELLHDDTVFVWFYAEPNRRMGLKFEDSEFWETGEE